MSDITPHTQNGLEPWNSSHPANRPSRALRRAVQSQAESAIVQRARLQALEYVVEEGLVGIANIASLEATLINSTPLSDPIQKAALASRLGAVANQHAIAVSRVLQRMV